MREQLRILNCGLRLRPDTVADDEAIVGMLRDTKWVNTILLMLPSYLQSPFAVDHELFKEAVRICETRAMRIIIGQRLWTDYLLADNGLCEPGLKCFDVSHYLAAIDNLHRLSRAISSDHVATCLDVEPYGSCAEKVAFKHGLSKIERGYVRAAVNTAIAKIGGVDMVIPYGSTNPENWKWLFGSLGHGITEKTYYTTADNYKVPNVNSPPGCEYNPRYWSVAIGTGSTEEQAKKHVPLVPRQIMAMKFSKMMAIFPGLQGIVIWGEHSLANDYGSMARARLENNPQ